MLPGTAANPNSGSRGIRRVIRQKPLRSGFGREGRWRRIYHDLIIDPGRLPICEVAQGHDHGQAPACWGRIKGADAEGIRGQSSG